MDRLIKLNSGTAMPRFGLGLYTVTGKNVTQIMQDAVVMGYRLFDTASAYKNEDEVGDAVRSCGVPRDELFITTKVWNTAQRIGDIEGAFMRSLERLQLDYVDLYLMHWPVAGCYPETWHAMEKTYRSGLTKAIGVCNFNELELLHLLENSDIVPAVNQIEYHPLCNQEKLRNFCQSKGIVVQASAPLARGEYLNRHFLKQMAEKYHRSTAQIGLRWLIQKDICVIPRSIQIDRLLENSQIFDFELDESEMAVIDQMNEDLRVINVPVDILN